MGKMSAIAGLVAVLISVTSCSGAESAGSPDTPSASQSQVRVPDVEGMKAGPAAARLLGELLDYRVIGSDAALANEWPTYALVTNQSIDAGSAAAPGTVVEITLNMTASEATAKLTTERAEASAAAAKEAAEAEAEEANKAAAAKAAQEKAAAEAQARADSEAAAAKAAAEKKAAEEKAARERHVTYIVEADGPIGVITYTNFVNNKMGQEQSSDEVMGPVTKVYTFDESAFGGRYSFWSLGVIAQAGTGTSKITCRILLNGNELSSQASTGQYSVVSCNAGG